MDGTEQLIIPSLSLVLGGYMKKYIIVSPRPKWGGSVVLHTLCKILSELGYDAKIFYTNTYIYKKRMAIYFWLKWIFFTIDDLIKCMLVGIFKNKISSYNKQWEQYIKSRSYNLKRKWLPFVDKDTVVIYPEVIYGDFLKAKKVVRYLLYYNRYADVKNAFGENDLFFTYRRVFNDFGLNPTCRILKISHYDLNLYKQTNFEKRTGKCYVIRKGKNRKDLPNKFEGTIVDDLSELEKVEVFNKCEYCISYDTQTAYSGIAALCGCISIVIPEEGKNKEDYIKYDDKSYGVAWGFTDEEISYAKSTQKKLLNFYQNINKESVNSVREFIKISDEYFR